MVKTSGNRREPLLSGDPDLIWVILAAATAVFAVQLDFFSVQAAVPQMADDLDTSASSLQWVVSGYLLATASFLIVAGRLADIFGRKRWLMVGAVIFGGTSLVGGAAATAEMLVVARIAQGVGAAILFPVALAITTNAFPARRVQRAVGLVFAIGAIGQAFGPLVGGILTDALSWRAVLWINVPVALAVIGLTWRGVKDSRDETVPRSIDVIGLLLVVASIASFTYGVDRASDWGWLAPQTLALIGAGLLGLAAFVFVETRTRYPILDVSLFKIRLFTVMTAAGSVGNMGAVVVIFLSMIFLQDVKGFSAVEAGAAFLTFSLGYAVSSLVSGRMERIPPWIVMSSAMLIGGLATIGMGLSGSLAPFIVLAAFSGFGLGIAWAYTSVVTQSVVPQREAGAASGTVLTVLVSAGGVALAIAISIYDSNTSPGATNEGSVIEAILIVYGICAALTAPLVALLGREKPARTQ